MKRLLFTAIALLGFLFANAQDFIYLPKSVSVKSANRTYTDKYMVNGEGQITQLLSTIDHGDDGGSLSSYTFCMIPKYDKKTGEVRSAKVYEYYDSRDKTIDPNLYISFDYKFTYITDTKIGVSVSRSDNSVFKHKKQGEITINDKGELVSSIEDASYGLEVNFEYDDKGNFLSLKDGASIYEFKYNDKKGALSDVNTPKWLIPFLYKYYFNVPSLCFTWGSTVNGVTDFSSYYTSDIEDKESIKVTYEYNEEGYPVSVNFEGTRDIHTGKGEIKYSKKKVKK